MAMSPTADFARDVRNFLARRGFVSGDPDATRVVVFDSRVWMRHAEGAMALLDAAEMQRALRFRFDHDRSAYVLAHALWRIALGLCLDTPPAQVPLVSSPLGQPLLPGTGLATSLSHSGARVALAVTAAATVGVDIEPFPSPRALDDLVPVFCTRTEAAALAALAPARRAHHALALWTRKEALLKAWGTGLRVDPCSFDAPAGQPVASPGTQGRCACSVRDLDFGSGLVGALALPGDVPGPCPVWIADDAAT